MHNHGINESSQQRCREEWVETKTFVHVDPILDKLMVSFQPDGKQFDSVFPIIIVSCPENQIYALTLWH